MEDLLPREILWADKTTMRDFLHHPLNERLYELYLNIKSETNAPHRDSLKLFNEVYYICSRVVYENAKHPSLATYFQEIKQTMGWDYTTSLVMQMVYAILAVRKGNTSEVNSFVEHIKTHYRLGEYITPFALFVEEAKKNGLFYDIHFTHENIKKTVETLTSEVLLKYMSQGNPVFHIEHAEIHVESPGNVVGNQITTK